MQMWNRNDKLKRKHRPTWSTPGFFAARACIYGISGFALPPGRSNKPRRKPGVSADNGFTEKLGLLTGPVA
jgi:hypothetical protein